MGYYNLTIFLLIWIFPPSWLVSFFLLIKLHTKKPVLNHTQILAISLFSTTLLIFFQSSSKISRTTCKTSIEMIFSCFNTTLTLLWNPFEPKTFYRSHWNQQMFTLISCNFICWIFCSCLSNISHEWPHSFGCGKLNIYFVLSRYRDLFKITLIFFIPLTSFNIYGTRLYTNLWYLKFNESQKILNFSNIDS